METLHTVLRAIRGETKQRRDHLQVFREFLGHLDRIGKRPAVAARSTATKSANAEARRGPSRGR